ncbi:MAG: methylmalonyl-CoA mutase family protein [Myxococcota bacterium]|nr:methylmalonyl-CoA mutase family protein [Myxococcota bacterium]
MSVAVSVEKGGLVSVERQEPLRFVTAASLFDGHDAAINIMRRLIQDAGGELIHLGHNRGVLEIVRAAIHEDADGIAISSYQGGHVEFFKYMVDLLKEHGAEHIRGFGGGGGVIIAEEIAELEAYGVEKIYSPEDGRLLGLEGMIQDLIQRTKSYSKLGFDITGCNEGVGDIQLGRLLSHLELLPQEQLGERLAEFQSQLPVTDKRVPVIGITGPGGAGKSSLTDELLNRFLYTLPEDARIAVLSIDPTRRKTGGALLGDRIRMNSLISERIFMRSMATRRSNASTNEILEAAISLLGRLGFELVIVETAGIGQSGTEIVDMVDLSLYVMTQEYGAASQLEKIDMLDFADLIALNKFEKRGSDDALRDIRKQWRRNHKKFDVADDSVPIYPTIASQFNDPGVNRLFCRVAHMLSEKHLDLIWEVPGEIVDDARELKKQAVIPSSRQRYLSEIADKCRSEKAKTVKQSLLAQRLEQLFGALKTIDAQGLPEFLQPYAAERVSFEDETLANLRRAYNETLSEIEMESLQLLSAWPSKAEGFTRDQFSYLVRGQEIFGDNYTTSLSQLRIPKVAIPKYLGQGDLLRFLREENLPGTYPYTAGLYPYKRAGEDPTRMFAGEGTPERTNMRFHYLCMGQPAKRLSTAFDSVTLYGEDPSPRPDIYGKIGNSGVSICTLDDMKKLYSGFDLCDPKTSVSMTINGPAPMILGFFLNAAIDQQVEKHLREKGELESSLKRIRKDCPDELLPSYGLDLPEGHDGFGLALLGTSGDRLVDAQTYEKIKKATLKNMRGTVQADILKEDQAQNTCIFSTEFALKMMGDIQEYFIENEIRNYYSVSISGYHIAEAGANPITQLAFTLANGFTFIEYYLSRGMPIDSFAPNLSFFFSNGIDPEYAVIGRVARRIWARSLRGLYGGNGRSQMLKYHIQTSGRSLHAQEIQFNDIRTTLQALYAIYDNCNSLHTNAYDEAITTPTEESVRRAMAIQLIINRELGLAKNENPLQGAFVIEELTELVEEAVLTEFDRITERGGVLGAMETMYQRGKIQDESMHYEGMKHDGSLPIVGVNMFLAKDKTEQEKTEIALIRSTQVEKNTQIETLSRFQRLNSGRCEASLKRLQGAARLGNNVFEAILESAKVCSLGQMSQALYQVGGQYRRNM